MSNIVVDSTASLNSALTSAHDGDTILLSAGTYDGMQANNLNFASGITITSADAAHQAVLTNFDMNNDHGVTLSNLELATKGTGYFVFNIIGSSNIHLDHLNIHGSMDGNATDDIEGVAVVTSDNVSITNSEFQQLERALLSNTTTNLTIANNYIHDVEVTGIVMANVSHINITGNAFSNFFPLDGEHPDAIQFETAGTTVASHDINITNNAIYLGTGQPTQGIFFRDQVGTLQYTNVNIANNLIDGTGYGGIAVDSVNNLSVTNNTLITLSNGYTTPLQLFDSNGVTVTGNQATSIAASANENNTGITASNNVTNAAAADGGLQALHDWLVAHPGSASDFAALVSDLGDIGSQLLPPAPAPIPALEPAPAPVFILPAFNLDFGYFKLSLGDFF